MMTQFWTLDDVMVPDLTSGTNAFLYRDTTDGQSPFYSADRSLLEDAVVSLTLGKNVLLRGPTGAGKTKFAEALAAKLKQPMEFINCSVDLDAEALLGFKTLEVEQDHSVVRYVEGPVVRAMQLGHVLYIDEINMARPETLPILNSLLDYRRQLTNPFTSQTVQAHERFRVVAAINEGYVGTMPMNEALKNRFVILDVPYLEGDPLARLITQSTSLSDERLIEHFVGLSADLVAASRVGELSEDAASIRALLDACDLASHVPPLRAVARAIAAKMEDERERELVMNLARTYFPEAQGQNR